MRLMAAILTEPTDPTRGVASLRGLDKALYKVERLKFAVALAWDTMQAMRSKRPDRVGDAQYVFMAPEYFFSNDRAQQDRFFGHNVKRAIISEIHALAKRYPKLLIIPGTLLWTKSTVTLDAGDNFALKGPTVSKAYGRLIQSDPLNWDGRKFDKGWAYSRADWSKSMLKSPEADAKRAQGAFNHDVMLTTPGYVTEIAQNVAYVCLGDKVLKYHKIGNFKEVFGEERNLVFIPGAIKGEFQVGAVKYGLEVCMDHGLGVLGATSDAHVRLIVSSFTPRLANMVSGNTAVTLHSCTHGTGAVAGVDPVVVDGRLAKILDTKAASATCKVFDINLDHDKLGIGIAPPLLTSSRMASVQHL